MAFSRPRGNPNIQEAQKAFRQRFETPDDLRAHMKTLAKKSADRRRGSRQLMPEEVALVRENLPALRLLLPILEDIARNEQTTTDSAA